MSTGRHLAVAISSPTACFGICTIFTSKLSKQTFSMFYGSLRLQLSIHNLFYPRVHHPTKSLIVRKSVEARTIKIFVYDQTTFLRYALIRNEEWKKIQNIISYTITTCHQRLIGLRWPYFLGMFRFLIVRSNMSCVQSKNETNRRNKVNQGS